MVNHRKSLWCGRAGLGLILIFCLSALSLDALPPKHRALTRVTVVVTDAETHKPIFQARLTLEFRDPQSHRGSTVSLSAKTDAQGKYVFSFIPMEPVVLVVTAPEHQTFGQKFNITEENQTLEVKLHPPQPLR